MKKLFTILAMLFVAIIAMTGCTSTSNEKMSTANSSDSQSVIDSLEKAKKITLKKKVFSFGDHWTVTADGVDVATIKGQAFYVIGDTYSMYSKAGNFVGAESEALRLINRKADLYNMDGKKTGHISQEVLSFFYKFEIKNDQDKLVGKMEQKFALGLKGDINTPSGVKAWEIKKDVVSWGASVNVTKMADSEIPAMSAVWMAVIASEIHEAQSESSK